MSAPAGVMRHRVRLFAPEGTRGDGTAQTIASHIPASITAVPLQFQQQERLAAGGVNAQTLYSIDIRYRPDVAKDLQLVEECCTERTFNIVTMIPSDKMDWLSLTCLVAS